MFIQLGLSSLRCKEVCDAWPVRRQTSRYIPNCMALPAVGRAATRTANETLFGTIHAYTFSWLNAATYWFRTGNTWLTVLLTLNRYMRVCQPLEFSRHCTVRRTCVVSTHERPRILVRGGVNAPLSPEVKNISKISPRHGAFWSILF